MVNPALFFFLTGEQPVPARVMWTFFLVENIMRYFPSKGSMKDRRMKKMNKLTSHYSTVLQTEKPIEKKVKGKMGTKETIPVPNNGELRPTYGTVSRIDIDSTSLSRIKPD